MFLEGIRPVFIDFPSQAFARDIYLIRLLYELKFNFAHLYFNQPADTGNGYEVYKENTPAYSLMRLSAHII